MAQVSVGSAAVLVSGQVLEEDQAGTLVSGTAPEGSTAKHTNLHRSCHHKYLGSRRSPSGDSSRLEAPVELVVSGQALEGHPNSSKATGSLPLSYPCSMSRSCYHCTRRSDRSLSGDSRPLEGLELGLERPSTEVGLGSPSKASGLGSEEPASDLSVAVLELGKASALAWAQVWEEVSALAVECPSSSTAPGIDPAADPCTTRHRCHHCTMR